MDLAAALDLGDRELVSFVGAGGKKTTMAALVAGGRGSRRIGYTTTTHMPPPDGLPLHVAGPADIQNRLASTLTADEPVAFASEWVTDPDRVEEKVRGFSPDTVDAIHESGVVDWTLVKADGARRREFKAPGDGEPVVPSKSTLLIPLASAKVVGAELSDDVVHRPERVAALTGTDVGTVVTAETVGRVLAHDEGGLKGRPSGARVVPVINKADVAAERTTARTVLHTAFDRTDRFEYGLITSHETGFLERVDP